MRRLGIVAAGLALVLGGARHEARILLLLRAAVLALLVAVTLIPAERTAASLGTTTGATVGAATLTPPFLGRLVLPYGYPTRAYANANDHPELDVTGSLTVEAWVKYVGDYWWVQNIAYKFNAYELDLGYSGSARCVGFFLWSVSGPAGADLCRWPPPYYSGWHHVAGVFSTDTGEMRTYLDGSLYTGPSPFTTTINNSSDILQVGYNLVGEIDELRISDTARYTGSTYSVPTSAFTCDEHTRALWHFDELDGATEFHDSCGAVDNLLVGYNGAHTEGGGPPPADLIETAVSDPPVSQNRGTSFSVTDTVKNLEGAAAAPSRTRYYFSTDTVRDAGDKLLTGARAVPGLAPGQSSTGSKTVTIPASTVLGTYYLLACADDTLLVPESDETNNCIASASTIQVTAPDLKETAVSKPPASVKQGGSFNVTDTAKNVGTGPAGASTTRYYLSLDKTKDAGDVLLTGSRAVPVLAVGANSSGTVGVTVPVATPLGTYYLLACADVLKVVQESKEGNNCRASGSQVQVTAP